MLCILINKLSTSFPRWALFTWAIVHLSTWVQCSMSNVHDEQSCSMQTEPAIVATNCRQPVPVMHPAIMIFVFWIINRISQLQFKHAQGSTFKLWNLEKKWGLLGQNLVGMSMTRQDKKSNSCMCPTFIPESGVDTSHDYIWLSCETLCFLAEPIGQSKEEPSWLRIKTNTSLFNQRGFKEWFSSVSDKSLAIQYVSRPHAPFGHIYYPCLCPVKLKSSFN